MVDAEPATPAGPALRPGRPRRLPDADAVGRLPDRRLHDRRRRGCRWSTPRPATSPTQRDDPAVAAVALPPADRAARGIAGARRRGTQRSIFGVAPDVLAWLREAGGERVLVLLNVGDEPRRATSIGVAARAGEVARRDVAIASGRVALADLVLAAARGPGHPAPRVTARDRCIRAHAAASRVLPSRRDPVTTTARRSPGRSHCSRSARSAAASAPATPTCASCGRSRTPSSGATTRAS